MPNDQLDLADAPEELQFGKLNHIEPATKIFFYQHKDADGDIVEGSDIFACKEQEAGMYGRFHKLIGVGEGKLYRQTILDECKKRGITKNKLVPINIIKEILQMAFDAELNAARGKKSRPKYQNVKWDPSVEMHPNAEEIKRSFVPPQ